MNICIYIYMYIYMYINLCMYVCMYVRTDVCMYVCMHACMHVCMYVVCTCMMMYDHVCILYIAFIYFKVPWNSTAHRLPREHVTSEPAAGEPHASCSELFLILVYIGNIG